MHARQKPVYEAGSRREDSDLVAIMFKHVKGSTCGALSLLLLAETENL